MSNPTPSPTATSTPSTPTATTTGTGEQPSTTTGGSSYTLAIVATHNSASSCWTTINGNVYDVTKWIAQHPGGQQAILGLCGKDGSAMFNGQHGTQARPNEELASFMIGALAQ